GDAGGEAQGVGGAGDSAGAVVAVLGDVAQGVDQALQVACAGVLKAGDKAERAGGAGQLAARGVAEAGDAPQRCGDGLGLAERAVVGGAPGLRIALAQGGGVVVADGLAAQVPAGVVAHAGQAVERIDAADLIALVVVAVAAHATEHVARLDKAVVGVVLVGAALALRVGEGGGHALGVEGVLAGGAVGVENHGADHAASVQPPAGLDLAQHAAAGPIEVGGRLGLAGVGNGLDALSTRGLRTTGGIGGLEATAHSARWVRPRKQIEPGPFSIVILHRRLRFLVLSRRQLF
ncbi:MAG: hypothetical protein ACK5QX_03300, partial [bacterium]